jgi:GNAT superfamily N-acetyltransferase
MNISIRQATIGDAAVVARFNSRIATDTEGITLDESRLLSGVQALLRDPSKGLYYLAELNNVAVGQISITYEWSDWRNGWFWWIQSVFVEEAVRGKGIFKSLFDHVHSLATARTDVCGLRLYVERENALARRTYERLGMGYSRYDLYEMDFVLQEQLEARKRKAEGARKEL